MPKQIILVNLVDLEPASIGGIRNLTLRQCRLLYDFHESVVFLVRAAFADQFAEWIDRLEAQVIPAPVTSNLEILVRAIRPTFVFTPLFGTFPLLETTRDLGIPHVICVPDALALERIDLLYWEANELEERIRNYHLLNSATMVITVSEYSRDRLIKGVGLSPQQIVVIDHGLGIDESTNGEAPDEEWPEHFVVYPANGWPNKRHELLLLTMMEVWKERPDLHLILTGWQPDGMLTELMEKHGCPVERVHALGFVSESLLAWLYDHALAMPFISEYEGSGTPILEAMARGCPVLCAPRTGVPEIAGDAALYIDSDEPTDWAEGILTELPQRREKLISRGREQAKKFTWERFIDEHRQLLLRLGVSLTSKPVLQQEISIPISEIATVLNDWRKTSEALYTELNSKEDFIQKTDVELQKLHKLYKDAQSQLQALLNNKETGLSQPSRRIPGSERMKAFVSRIRSIWRN